MTHETLHAIITHPIILGWWGAFSVDFYQWLRADGWSLSVWNWNTATKRWAVGLIGGVIAWGATSL